jgi:para-nitrobenzyl esterase
MTIVETAYGKVKGTKLEEVYSWKGIPYAKAPVGSLRFRPPVKPEPWGEVRNASEFGPVAAQASSEIMNFLGNEIENMSEDCLYVNVWSPAADNKRRPVLVWIHGGAFVSGSGSSSWYDGASFASKGDVVVVTINYRLGPLGFLHLGEIGGEEFASSGNCGILDQVAALEWVKENIEAFGGDPNRVTIFGESAGAMSIGVLLGLPSAQGLFQQAILQSGAARNAIPQEKATKIAQKLLQILNIDPSNLSELENIPVEKLLEASNQLPPMSLVPVIDGVSLPQHPEAAVANGSAKDVKILIGTNKDEYNLFTVFDPIWKNANQQTMEVIFEKTFGPFWPVLSKHLGEGHELSQDLYNELMTTQVFTYPALKLAEAQVNQGAPVWMYRFDWESPVFGGALKATHALEIPFVWNTLNKPKTENLTGDSPNRQIVSDQMHDAWIAFAKYGDPSTKVLQNWPQYDLEKRSTLIFNEHSSIVEQPNEEKRLQWEKAMVNLV